MCIRRAKDANVKIISIDDTMGNLYFYFYKKYENTMKLWETIEEGWERLGLSISVFSIFNFVLAFFFGGTIKLIIEKFLQI